MRPFFDQRSEKKNASFPFLALFAPSIHLSALLTVLPTAINLPDFHLQDGAKRPLTSPPGVMACQVGWFTHLVLSWCICLLRPVYPELLQIWHFCGGSTTSHSPPRVHINAGTWRLMVVVYCLVDDNAVTHGASCDCLIQLSMHCSATTSLSFKPFSDVIPGE